MTRQVSATADPPGRNRTAMDLKERLIDDLGIWGECEDFPRQDWKCEVQNDDTNLGYWDWVVEKHRD